MAMKKLKAIKEALKELKQEIKEDNIVYDIIKKAIEIKTAFTHLWAFLFGGAFIPLVFYKYPYDVAFIALIAQFFLLVKTYKIAKNALIEEEEKRIRQEE